MKLYFILGVICIVGTYASRTKKEYDSDTLECAKKSNFDIAAFDELAADKSFVPPKDYQVPKEHYCFMSCLDHKKGNNWNYYEELMKQVKSVDDQFFKDKTHTRENLENVLNQCKSRGLDECGFLHCIKYIELPFFKLYKYVG